MYLSRYTWRAMKAVKFTMRRSTIPCASQPLVFIMKGYQLLQKENQNRVRLGYSGIRIYSGIYSGYSAPGSRTAGMEIQIFRNENSSQTNAYCHHSSYSYSGLIPNERALNLLQWQYPEYLSSLWKTRCTLYLQTGNCGCLKKRFLYDAICVFDVHHS